MTDVQVWGRDEGGAGLSFKQEDIDKVVNSFADLRHPMLSLIIPMTAMSGRTLLNLCVSE